MATLQKFKLLATQCAIADSPTRSPTASPVIHLRRRKTLRMLLGRSGGGRRLPRREESPDRQSLGADPPEESKALISHTLKDLFVSSPSPPHRERLREDEISGYSGGFSFAMNRGSGSTGRRGSTGSPRPVRARFRYRLLSRVWRPVLGPIPE